MGCTRLGEAIPGDLSYRSGGPSAGVERHAFHLLVGSLGRLNASYCTLWCGRQNYVQPTRASLSSVARESVDPNCHLWNRPERAVSDGCPFVATASTCAVLQPLPSLSYSGPSFHRSLCPAGDCSAERQPGPGLCFSRVPVQYDYCPQGGVPARACGCSRLGVSHRWPVQSRPSYSNAVLATSTPTLVRPRHAWALCGQLRNANRLFHRAGTHAVRDGRHRPVLRSRGFKRRAVPTRHSRRRPRSEPQPGQL